MDVTCGFNPKPSHFKLSAVSWCPVINDAETVGSASEAPCLGTSEDLRATEHSDYMTSHVRPRELRCTAVYYYATGSAGAGELE